MRTFGELPHEIRRAIRRAGADNEQVNSVPCGDEEAPDQLGQQPDLVVGRDDDERLRLVSWARVSHHGAR